MTMRIENYAVRALGKNLGVEFSRHLGSDFPDGQDRDEVALHRDVWLNSAHSRGIDTTPTWKGA